MTRAIMFSLTLCIMAALHPAAAQQLHYSTSWVGNSFGGVKMSDAPYHNHVQISADDVFVASDGTVYTDTGWDEDGLEAGFYRNGRVQGALEILSHGWGRQGGGAVTASSKYVFAAMAQNGDDGANAEQNANAKPQYPPAHTQWYCVRRFTRSGQSAPFPAGYGIKNDMLIVNTVIKSGDAKPTDAGYTDEGVKGLAADSAGRLFVSDAAHNHIKVYDAETMTQTASWPCERPGKLASEDSRHLWVLQSGNAEQPPRIARYDTLTGLPLTQKIVGNSGWNPIGMTIDPRGRMLVADSGPDQDIKFYTHLAAVPALSFSFGVKGGVFSGAAGRVGPQRFNMPVGAGADALGNVYVYSRGAVGVGEAVDGQSLANGGSVIESYAPSGKRNWQLLGLEFVDCADTDPASESDVYTKEEHFRMDYSKASGQEWSYQGYTVNRLKYPDDARLHTAPNSVFVRRIGGRLFLYTTDMFADSLTVSRFVSDAETECAVPTALFCKSHRSGAWPQGQPTGGEWIWSDSNGDGKMAADEYDQPAGKGDAPGSWGWDVDARGGVWQAATTQGIRYFPCAGLGIHGNPRYSYASMQSFPMPAPFTELCRVDYVPQTDTLFLAGYTTQHPHSGQEWGIVGTEVMRYDGWEKGNRTASTRIVLPYTQGPLVYIKAMCIAGNYLFAAEGRAPARVFVYDIRSGELLGAMQPDATVGSSSGWVDTPYGIRAIRRSSGEYSIFVEEDLDAKVLLYRWTPDKH